MKVASTMDENEIELVENCRARLLRGMLIGFLIALPFEVCTAGMAYWLFRQLMDVTGR